MKRLIVAVLLTFAALLPLQAGAQSLSLPAMPPSMLLRTPQRFAMDPRTFLAQAVVPLSTVEAAQPDTPPVTSGLAALPSLWLPVSFGPAKSFALGINKTLNGTYADVARDVYNGMWAIGYGVETEQLWHQDAISGAVPRVRLPRPGEPILRWRHCGRRRQRKGNLCSAHRGQAADRGPERPRLGDRP